MWFFEIIKVGCIEETLFPNKLRIENTPLLIAYYGNGDNAIFSVVPEEPYHHFSWSLFFLCTVRTSGHLTGDTFFSDLKSFMDVLVPVKIPGDGGPGDIFNGPLLQGITVQFEFPAVAGKDQDPIGG